MADISTDVKRKDIKATLKAQSPIFVKVNTKKEGNVSVNFNGRLYVFDKDYDHLDNKPSIEGVTLSGNKELQELGLSEISNQEITDMLNKVFED